jgi:PAS domain S-box-containing protein
MRPRPNLEQRLVGFACAVVLEPLAVAGTLHSAAFREIPWTLSYPVIALAAEIGGVEPALLACGIAVTGIFHFLLSQRGLPDHIVWEQNAAFGVAALFLVYLIRQRKRTATALSASETHYRSVAETASDVIVTIDERSSILSINPAVKGMFGYEPEELIGRPLTVLMPERLRGQHVAAVSRFLKNGERKVPWSGVQLPGLRSDGEEIPLEISFATYKTGQRQQFTGFIRDVSERTKTQAALLESEKLAAVGRLMSSIAHEINNPLESVTNLLYLVRNSVDPEEAAAYLRARSRSCGGWR